MKLAFGLGCCVVRTRGCWAKLAVDEVVGWGQRG